MNTTLYRPVGLKEMRLIMDMGYMGFPQRLEWQPIFYPVMNREYAEQIAERWNTKDEFSGYCGIVTKFDLPADYLLKYEVHNVGGFIHNELWVPAEDLDEFNHHIVGQIEIVTVFTGTAFIYDDTDPLHIFIKNLNKL